MKTTVANIITEIIQDADYNISDSDLVTLVTSGINKAIKRVKQLLISYGFTQDVTCQTSFKTIDSQAYVDVAKAQITGDATTFTGVAGDTVTVTIDGTATAGIALGAGVTTVTLAATAINTAVDTTVATVNGGGYLVITSPTTGVASSVTIADTAGTASTRLFTVAVDRTHTAIADLDEIIKLTERTNDSDIPIIPYSDLITIQPDPTSSESSTPDFAARFNNYIYFTPTPSSAIRIYLDYFHLITDVATGGTMPFEDKYDPLIVAMAHLNLARWLDSSNAVPIADLKDEIKTLQNELIINAVKNIGMDLGPKSRKGEIPYFAPRKVV